MSEPNDRLDWSADDWRAFLEANDDKVLLFVDEDSRIHEFLYSEGELVFFADGDKGYDDEGTAGALETFAEDGGTAYKVVEKTAVRSEREKLAEGEYETISEWTNHDAHGEGDDGG